MRVWSSMVPCETSTSCSLNYPILRRVGTRRVPPRHRGRLSIPIAWRRTGKSGDLVVSDADGVVIIPRNDVDAVLEAAAG
jgi:regulator of RNase E activity RraA